MEKTVRFRTRLSDGIANIKLMIFHEMETGYRKDKNSGEIIPQHFIHTVHVDKNNERVLEVHWSRSVSKNPYLNFMVPGAQTGDTITVTWFDNKGFSGDGSVELK